MPKYFRFCFLISIFVQAKWSIGRLISKDIGIVIANVLREISFIDMRIEPKVIGIDNNKENFKEFFSFMPDKMPAERVMPKREMPGRIANICAMPIIIEFL